MAQENGLYLLQSTSRATHHCKLFYIFFYAALPRRRSLSIRVASIAASLNFCCFLFLQLFFSWTWGLKKTSGQHMCGHLLMVENERKKVMTLKKKKKKIFVVDWQQPFLLKKSHLFSFLNMCYFFLNFHPERYRLAQNCVFLYSLRYDKIKAWNFSTVSHFFIFWFFSTIVTLAIK